MYINIENLHIHFDSALDSEDGFARYELTVLESGEWVYTPIDDDMSIDELDFREATDVELDLLEEPAALIFDPEGHGELLTLDELEDPDAVTDW